jgi:hypothetical protein
VRANSLSYSLALLGYLNLERIYNITIAIVADQ